MASARIDRPEFGWCTGENALAIDGRINDLDYVASRTSDLDTGIMKLVTTLGDTLLLLMPANVQCGAGTSGSPGLEEGMMLRVYLSPEDAQLALKHYVPVEWAEVDCAEGPD